MESVILQISATLVKGKARIQFGASKVKNMWENQHLNICANQNINQLNDMCKHCRFYQPGSIAHLAACLDCRPRGSKFKSQLGHLTFMEVDLVIFS